MRHRCQDAPGSAEPIAATSPGWASEMTSWTPDRPRATSPRRNANQPAPSSPEATSRPRISRWPSAFTAVAIRACTLTTRPSSRTLTVSASTQQNVYGPASSGRSRNAATWASRWVAISLTCERDKRLDPELLGELLHPPRGDPEQVGGRDDGDQGLLGAAAMGQQPVREVGAVAQLGHRELDGARPGCPSPGPGSRCGGCCAAGCVRRTRRRRADRPGPTSTRSPSW